MAENMRSKGETSDQKSAGPPIHKAMLSNARKAAAPELSTFLILILIPVAELFMNNGVSPALSPTGTDLSSPGSNDPGKIGINRIRP